MYWSTFWSLQVIACIYRSHGPVHSSLWVVSKPLSHFFLLPMGRLGPIKFLQQIWFNLLMLKHSLADELFEARHAQFFHFSLVLFSYFRRKWNNLKWFCSTLLQVQCVQALCRQSPIGTSLSQIFFMLRKSDFCIFQKCWLHSPFALFWVKHILGLTSAFKSQQPNRKSLMLVG